MFRNLLLVIVLLIVSAGPAAAAITPLSLGDTFSHNICNGDVDTLRFTVSAGDRLEVILTECWDNGGSCSAYCCCFDQQIDVYDPLGSIEAHSTTGAQGNCCECLAVLTCSDVPIAVSGNHLVTVHDANYHGGGQYSVFVQRTNNPGRSSVLKPLDDLLETIDLCGQVKTYQVAGHVADSLVISMTHGEIGSIGPQLELYDPSGRAVAKPGNGNLRAYLTANGMYTLFAHGGPNQTGTYHLKNHQYSTPTKTTTWGHLRTIYR